MGLTAIEKIIAHKTKKSVGKAGEFVYVDIDLAMANDVTTALTFDVFKKEMKCDKVWDKDKIIIVYDHYFPADNVNNSNVLVKIRKVCNDQHINFFENEGICHQVMLEKFVFPGQVIAGADSHTCTYGALGTLALGVGSTDLAAVFATGKIWMKVPETVKIYIKGNLPNGVYAKDVILKIIGDHTASGFGYKVMEFCGPAVERMEISDRATLCNMAVEGGAKTSFITPDKKTLSFVEKRSGDFQIFKSDEDATFCDTLEYDVSNAEPMLACPYTVDNVKPLKEVEGLAINQAFLGACTNGRIEDLRTAASIARGRKIKDGVRMYVVPASVQIYKQAIAEGIIDDFLSFGATVNHPCCSNCWGACQAILGDGERQVSSANRNFKGRNGSLTSETYLASPASVVASAVKGKIADPREFL